MEWSIWKHNTCVLKDFKVLPLPLLLSSALRHLYSAAQSTFPVRQNSTAVGVLHHMVFRALSQNCQLRIFASSYLSVCQSA